MRKILFRGKAIYDGYGHKDGDWFSGNLIEEIRPGYMDYYINPKTNGRKIMVYMETVSQYIGLKDYNGNEVFEGDIIQDRDDGTLGLVYCWDNDEQSFKIEFNDIVVSAEDMSHYQIVGNKWDNPELLKDI